MARHPEGKILTQLLTKTNGKLEVWNLFHWHWMFSYELVTMNFFQYMWEISTFKVIHLIYLRSLF